MDTQIAVRLNDEDVALLDELVNEGAASSRVDALRRMIEKERRQWLAAQDARIYAESSDPDLDALTAWARQGPRATEESTLAGPTTDRSTASVQIEVTGKPWASTSGAEVGRQPAARGGAVRRPPIGGDQPATGWGLAVGWAAGWGPSAGIRRSVRAARVMAAKAGADAWAP
jgi:Arc/MetJ-type ribon-helix-helix transcriptional regulator